MPYEEVCFQRMKDENSEEDLQYKSQILNSFSKLRNEESLKS